MSPTFVLPDARTGTDYWIYVHAPQPPVDPGPWPAVLFMDGDDQFSAATGAYDELRAANAIRPLLLVGIGYGASYSRPRNRRGRDYTPVAHSDEPSSGGGDDFLRFLSASFWPQLLDRYPVADGPRGIAGHSLGSLLVLHALFQPQPFFTHHLASAPSIWWADRAILQQADRLRARQPALPAELFLDVGLDDTASMTGDLDLLEAQLNARPFAALDVSVRRFPGRNHYNVLPDAFREGLRTLFNDAPTPAGRR